MFNITAIESKINIYCAEILFAEMQTILILCSFYYKSTSFL